VFPVLLRIQPLPLIAVAFVRLARGKDATLILLAAPRGEEIHYALDIKAAVKLCEGLARSTQSRKFDACDMSWKA
jgi:hypothetical protein